MKKIKQVNLLLKTSSLSYIANFEMIISKSWNTAIRSIFVDSTKLNSSSVFSVVNGLLNHDAQLIIINSISSVTYVLLSGKPEK